MLREIMARSSVSSVLVLLLGLSSYGVARDGVAGDKLRALRPIESTDTLLIVAPHPDDESLCCGGLIDSARRSGAAVAVVWITFGDGFRWSAMLAEHRV